MIYETLIVMQIGQTPNLKKMNPSFLYQGKWDGMIGQLMYSFIVVKF
ncbi:hypothetical protein GGD38_007550 [Chitinophagaceae bacterium OAS944]|nr:hypothetical protein [Chitinophagaceae bacterium OAS944]